MAEAHKQIPTSEGAAAKTAEQAAVATRMEFGLFDEADKAKLKAEFYGRGLGRRR
jgi:hypothetical protein